jgi:hypothetical protein
MGEVLFNVLSSGIEDGYGFIGVGKNLTIEFQGKHRRLEKHRGTAEILCKRLMGHSLTNNY